MHNVVSGLREMHKNSCPVCILCVYIYVYIQDKCIFEILGIPVLNLEYSGEI